MGAVWGLKPFYWGIILLTKHSFQTSASVGAEQGEGEIFLRNATQIKNIWVPYGA